jgi:hypothetical protein
MENLMANASNAIEKVAKFYIELLGSKGKA